MQKYLDPGSEESMSILDDAGRFTIAAGRFLERDAAERFKRLGLTVSDTAPLTRLVQLGPMTPGELLESSVLLSSAPVVSHSLNRLERAGLVSRRPHDTDGRMKVVEATDAGRDILVLVLKDIYEFLADFFDPLTEEELSQFRMLLLRCLDRRLP
jgi:DNA-binding MarR family transcriptional regulator